MTRSLRGLLAVCVGLVVVLPAAPSYADGVRNSQWHVQSLRLAEAHRLSQGKGVIVAVIDSGVRQDHRDLAGNILPGTDIAAGGSGSGWGDNDGHGTAMAGLIAAHGHGTNGVDGALGVAPEAKILPIRVDTAKGSAVPGSFYAEGIRWAVAHGAKIINISASAGAGTFDAVKEAHAAGIIVVGSAGNKGKDVFIGEPASYDGYAIGVGGTDRNGNHAEISLTGAAIDIAAPANDVVSTARDGGYRTGTGTSDSAAIVSGALALIWSKYPNLTRDEVLWRLVATATDKGPMGKDPETGYGLINIVAALTADVGPVPSSAPPTTAPAAATTPASPSASSQPDEPKNSVPLLVGGSICLIAVLIAAIFVVIAARRRRKP